MTEHVTQQVVDAFTANDLDALSELMAPGLTWHEVLDLMRRQVAAGVRAEVVESRVAGSCVLVGLAVSAPEGVLPDDMPRDQPAYKVITTRAGRVSHIQDCVDRSHAAGLAGVT